MSHSLLLSTYLLELKKQNQNTQIKTDPFTSVRKPLNFLKWLDSMIFKVFSSINDSIHQNARPLMGCRKLCDAHHPALAPLISNTHWRLQGMKLHVHSENYAHGS